MRGDAPEGAAEGLAATPAAWRTPRAQTEELVAFRHGLRVSGLVALRWEQVDLKKGLLHVRRRTDGMRQPRILTTDPRAQAQRHVASSEKAALGGPARQNGIPSAHPLHRPELRALRQLERGRGESPYVFVTERKGPMTDSAFRKIVAHAGEAAGLEMPVHPHMLRHATGFKLANDGQDTRVDLPFDPDLLVGCWARCFSLSVALPRCAPIVWKSALTSYR